MPFLRGGIHFGHQGVGFFVPRAPEGRGEELDKSLMGRWLFICRVLEGSISWTEIQDLPLDEIDYLHEEAVEINAKRNSDLRAAKSKSRGRR